MSTQAIVVQEDQHRDDATTSASFSSVRLFSWAVLREFWEHRSLYIAPIVVAIFVLLGYFFGPFGVRRLTSLDGASGAPAQVTELIPYDLVAGLIMVTTLIVGVFYSLDALYAERRDRSILFWKSLPVSDLLTVMAKASIPLLVLPVVAIAVTIGTHLIMAIGSGLVLHWLGSSATPFWSRLALPQMWIWLLAHLLVTSAIWYAPFFAWFLLVSSWTTRAPLLVAFLPPVALATLERIVLHTNFISTALSERLQHGNLSFTDPAKGSTYLAPSLRTPALHGFATVSCWLGLIVAALLLAAAIQIRRYKTTL